uniref:Uncharacterized protein n=1 Tax=Oryza nivara TaxID=4536 RepID=A0A0E0H6F9_ORYNI
MELAYSLLRTARCGGRRRPWRARSFIGGEGERSGKMNSKHSSERIGFRLATGSRARSYAMRTRVRRARRRRPNGSRARGWKASGARPGAPPVTLRIEIHPWHWTKSRGGPLPSHGSRLPAKEAVDKGNDTGEQARRRLLVSRYSVTVVSQILKTPYNTVLQNRGQRRYVVSLVCIRYCRWP